MFGPFMLAQASKVPRLVGALVAGVLHALVLIPYVIANLPLCRESLPAMFAWMHVHYSLMYFLYMVFQSLRSGIVHRALVAGIPYPFMNPFNVFLEILF